MEKTITITTTKPFLAFYEMSIVNASLLNSTLPTPKQLTENEAGCFRRKSAINSLVFQANLKQ